MASSFLLVLDTTPPANPILTINDGALITGSPVVSVQTVSPSDDVAQVKVWGDLDMLSDPRFAVNEGDSQWIVWSPEIWVQLTAEPGRKFVYARLMDDCGNETPAFNGWIDLDLSTPVVSIVSPPDTARISGQVGHNLCTFSFAVSTDFDRWELRAVQSAGDPSGSGILVQSNVGTFLADIPIVVTVDGALLRTYAPGDGQKILKVFAHSTTGWWSG